MLMLYIAYMLARNYSLIHVALSIFDREKESDKERVVI